MLRVLVGFICHPSRLWSQPFKIRVKRKSTLAILSVILLAFSICCKIFSLPSSSIGSADANDDDSYVKTLTIVLVRLFLINFVEPWYDWQQWHRRRCLLASPRSGNEISQDFSAELPVSRCRTCADLLQIPAVTYSDKTDVVQRVISALDNELPLIVRGEGLTDTAENVFDDATYCDNLHATNLPFKYGQIASYARAVDVVKRHREVHGADDGGVYFAWSGCFGDGGGHNTKPPVYMPKMIEPDSRAGTWTFLASDDYATLHWPVPVDFGQNVLWLTQLYGQGYVELVPKSACEELKMCPTLRANLTSGDSRTYSVYVQQCREYKFSHTIIKSNCRSNFHKRLVIVTSQLWSLNYGFVGKNNSQENEHSSNTSSVYDQITLAVASAGNWR